MRKQGYRYSTIKYCIQSVKSVARRSSLLRPESAKSYLAVAQISESRKTKLTEDLARFYAYKHVPFDKPKTKDILHVKQLLGHKDIRNTFVYTHLVNFEADEWICKVATSRQERVTLIESGFTFVSKEGAKRLEARPELIRDIRMDGRVHNNEMERMNGETRDRERVMRTLEKSDSPILSGMQIYHNYVRPHEGLDGRTPSEAAGIRVEGTNKWLTLIQNAKKQAAS